MKHLLSVISLLSLFCMAYAKPALREPIYVTHPDGTVDTLLLHGDEFMHWMTRPNGQWVTYRQGKVLPIAPMTDQQIMETRRLSPVMPVAQATMENLPINLAPRGLVIMVEFPDLHFRAENTQAAMDSMYNADVYHYDNGWWRADSTKFFSHPACGSVAQYFRDQSMGQYTPHFDVIGPVMADSSYVYYGHNVGMTKDVHIRELIREVVIKADSLVDYSLYDNDGDGRVDYVYVIYAGNAESDGKGDEYIWPKKWNINAVTLDGKTISLFGCGSELNGRDTRDGIGTFVHEFSHILGFPDLYTTIAKDTVTMKGVHKTLGIWDVMDYGPYNDNGNRPPSYSAYERWFFGWLTPTLLDTVQNDTLGYIGTTNQAYLISATDEMPESPRGSIPATYYLLENRQLTGWDTTGVRSFASDVYIPGAGLLVEKIQYNPTTWRSSTVNNDAQSCGVSIVPADGLMPTYMDYMHSRGRDMGYLGKQGDLFPFVQNDSTIVDSMAVDSAHYICHIRHQDGQIIFGYLGGIQEEIPDTSVIDTVETALPETLKINTECRIYTISGHYVGSDVRNLHDGLYIILSNDEDRLIRKKVVIRR